MSEKSDDTVLVIGGTGGVGTGIVEALLATDSFARVIVSSRDPEKLVALRTRTAAHERLVTVHGSVDELSSAAALLGHAREFGSLRAVVASLGGWWEGASLTELGEAEWHAGLRTLLTPHFVAARTFVPALERAGCRYLLVGGGAARTPVPGSTLVSIAGAAQLMLTRALVAERRGWPFPIIEELIIDGAVRTHAAPHGMVTDADITAREVGEVVACMLADGTTGAWPHVTRDGPVAVMYSKS